MAEYKSNVQETSATTGTGNLTLVGATAGNRRVGDAVAVGKYIPYHIQASDDQWERGYGEYSALDTLTREFVMESSNAGALITLPAGTHTVTLPPTPDLPVRRGYKLVVDDLLSLADAVDTPLTFNWIYRDTEGLMGSLTKDLPVPAWCDFIRVELLLHLQGTGTGDVEVVITDSGASMGDNGWMHRLYPAVDMTKNPTLHLVHHRMSTEYLDTDRFMNIMCKQSTGAVVTDIVNTGWVDVEFLG
jgi:hypothetical protein